VLGRHKPKQFDQEYMRTHFGPEAVAARAQELSQRIMASPYGQQLMASAAESGQGLQTDMARRAAESGLSPDTGGQSAASDFATSAASQAQGAFERGAKSNVFQNSLGVAQGMVDAERQNALANQAETNAQPNMWQKIGGVASTTASMFPPTPGSAQAPVTAPATSALAMPNAVVQAGMDAARGGGPVQSMIGRADPGAAATQASGFGAPSGMARVISSQSPSMSAVRKPSRWRF
jgi:hypothetical protein